MYEPKTEHVLPGAVSENKLSELDYPLPDRDSFSEEERAAYDYVLERSKRFFYSLPANQGKEYHITAYYRLLLQSPLAAEMWARGSDLFQTAESRGSFSNRARDLVQVAMVPVLKQQLAKAPPNPMIPIAYAIESGIAAKDIKAIWDGRLDELSAADRVLVDYVQATTKGNLERSQFEDLVAQMGIRAAIDYTSFITYKIGSFRNIQAMHAIEGLDSFDDGVAEEFVQAHIDGQVAPSDYGGGASWVSKKS